MNVSDVHRTEGEPHERMTRLGKVMLDALAADPEYIEGMQVVIMLRVDERAGTVLDGFDNDAQATAFMLAHVQAVLAANGQRMLVVPLRQG